jgi:hypothetical protein
MLEGRMVGKNPRGRPWLGMNGGDMDTKDMPECRELIMLIYTLG